MILAGIALKTGISAGLMLLILACGRVLHTTGRPYLAGLFTAHIVATVVLTGYIIIILLQLFKYIDPASGLTALITGGAISLLILTFTGLFLSLERYLILSLWLHRLATLGFIASLAGIIWRIAAA